MNKGVTFAPANSRSSYLNTEKQIKKIGIN
jgi:spore germination cell wall hydrolase CwlJ-like protein